jgi:hypothetical protein
MLKCTHTHTIKAPVLQNILEFLQLRGHGMLLLPLPLTAGVHVLPSLRQLHVTASDLMYADTNMVNTDINTVYTPRMIMYSHILVYQKSKFAHAHPFISLAMCLVVS